MKKFKIIYSLLLIFFMVTTLRSQGKVYEGPDDTAGDPNLERIGRMTGNRVLIVFKNNTEIGDWPLEDASKWPNNNSGCRMNDGIGLILGAHVRVAGDSLPIENSSDLTKYAAQGMTISDLYFCQTNYREEMDMDPTGTIEWGLHSADGYSNINSETPAISNDSDSWPIGGWPSSGNELKWAGEWNGRFGRGVTYADLESFIVANDAQDQEYLGDEDSVKYYPRPGVFIGDKKADITTQKGAPWGGLGVRVEMRGFQWNNAHARDAVFWEYTIANISDYDIPEMTFGYWVDNDIGGDGLGEDAYFRGTPLNLSYAWDKDGVGEGGLTSGIQGFAYLESPGISDDGEDNDQDGLVDEARDNQATAKIGATDGINDLSKFLEYYGYDESDLAEHWDADEDQDWNDGIDENNNGVYDADEYSGDDIGTDGVGPSDLNYEGPDVNGTECNHMPDYVEGIGSEPNFASVDISESDMLGLTTFRLFEVPEHVVPYESWFRNDESMFEMTSGTTMDEESSDLSNLAEVFASGVFPLYEGRTERISMAELHSYEDQTGLVSADHSAPALFKLKTTVQLIYEKDYRFAQPPEMPTLTATPGDGCVILTWDNRADQLTQEPFLQGANDFEGYKLFRSTDKYFEDSEIITDGYGTATYKKPIYQCDLIDDLEGFTDYALQNGTGYYLGEDTGISHSFIDSTVQNGRTYYYALIAYDYGISPEMIETGNISSLSDEEYGIAPSENNTVIEVDEAEDVTFIGKNVAVVTPGANPAGSSSSSEGDVDYSGLVIGTGEIIPEVIVKEDLEEGHTYKVTFHTSNLNSIIYPELEDAIKFYEDRGTLYTASGVSVYDITSSEEELVFEDKLVENSSGNMVANNYNTMLSYYYDGDQEFYHLPVSEDGAYSDIFDGIRLKINMSSLTATLNEDECGWLTGNAPINIQFYEKDALRAPWDYYIIFTEDATNLGNIVSVYGGHPKTPDGESIDVFTECLNPQITKFPFYVENRSFAPDSLTGEYEKMAVLCWDLNANGAVDLLEDQFIIGPRGTNISLCGTFFHMDFHDATSEDELPQPNDTYKVTFNRPFGGDDYITFTATVSDTIDTEELKESMNDIKVVPNPYVATNMMEPAVSNTQLNQSRRIMFTHIPTDCTIKIFTVSGVLVETIHAPEDGLVDYNGLGDYSTGCIHWDLLSSEGLEVAAGMYIFHVEDKLTGKEKIGKFAIIK